MSVNFFTIIATMINFIILFLIVKHFLYDKVDKVIVARQNEINTSITQSKKDMEEAKRLREENEKQLKNARQEGKSIIEEYKKSAESLKQDIVNDANKEAQLIVDRARKESERSKEKIEDEVKSRAVDLAVLLAMKALQNTVNEENQRELIKDFINKVGA